MRNDSSNHKKTTFYVIFIALIVFLIFPFLCKNRVKNFAHAEPANESQTVTEEEIKNNIDSILNDIDSDELDEFLYSSFDVNFFSADSFKTLVSKLLDGTYFDEYNSLLSGILSFLKSNIKGLFAAFFALLVIVLMHQIFGIFCLEKHEDLKKAMHIVFSLLIALAVIMMLKNVIFLATETINKIFNFTKILFPILLNLILLSGSASSHSVYSSLSVFLLNTGSYVFIYLLLPISISLMLLSVLGSAVGGNRFSKVSDLLKTIFKYAVMIFFGVFGVLSAVNLVMSGAKDGVSLKITKYAIKNYIPVLGGYISEGFDFVHTCSILIKNAFGICGIVVLLMMVLEPLILYIIYMFMFKLLSLFVSLLGDDHFSTMFENVSKSLSYFIAVLVGVFLIMFVLIFLLVLSVSVV